MGFKDLQLSVDGRLSGSEIESDELGIASIDPRNWGKSREQVTQMKSDRKIAKTYKQAQKKEYKTQKAKDKAQYKINNPKPKIDYVKTLEDVNEGLKTGRSAYNLYTDTKKAVQKPIKTVKNKYAKTETDFEKPEKGIFDDIQSFDDVLEKIKNAPMWAKVVGGVVLLSIVGGIIYAITSPSKPQNNIPQIGGTPLLNPNNLGFVQQPQMQTGNNSSDILKIIKELKKN